MSVEDQDSAWRVDLLRRVPARVRFVSAEPLLGPVDLALTGVHWVISGGESGPGHRRFDPAWALAIRDRCAAAGAAFFHKQNGGRTPKAGGRLLGGKQYDGMPAYTPRPVPRRPSGGGWRRRWAGPRPPEPGRVCRSCEPAPARRPMGDSVEEVRCPAPVARWAGPRPRQPVKLTSSTGSRPSARVDARGGTTPPGLVEAHFHPTYFDVAAPDDLDVKYPVEYVTRCMTPDEMHAVVATAHNRRLK